MHAAEAPPAGGRRTPNRRTVVRDPDPWPGRPPRRGAENERQHTPLQYAPASSNRNARPASASPDRGPFHDERSAGSRQDHQNQQRPHHQPGGRQDPQRQHQQPGGKTQRKRKGRLPLAASTSRSNANQHQRHKCATEPRGNAHVPMMPHHLRKDCEPQQLHAERWIVLKLVEHRPHVAHARRHLVQDSGDDGRRRQPRGRSGREGAQPVATEVTPSRQRHPGRRGRGWKHHERDGVPA